jgi:uncharacterized protein (DUF1810 family)
MKTTGDPYDLQRFVDAQRGVYARAEAELRAGRKESHWMWYIFPQIKGLGQSAMAQKYALSSVAEATDYLKHPELGTRVRECTRIVTAIDGRSAQVIFGHPDYLKFHSSMTLFAHATSDNKTFMDALRKYYRSEFDPQTVERL